MSDECSDQLPTVERVLLLRLARDSIACAVSGAPLPQVDLECLPPTLTKPRACFVTLTERDSGALRGCTGVLTANLPLAQEVIRTAAETALHDPRFEPVMPIELDGLRVEISLLTPPVPLDVEHPDDIPRLLRPGIDGVTLTYRTRCRATFLPQVWEKLPDPVEFLDRLCLKMGLPPGTWREPGMEVEVYQVEKFCES